MKIYVVSNRTILFVNIVVFSVSGFVNWLKSDLPYWPLLFHEAGFIWAEVPFVIFYKTALLGLLDTGASVLLLLMFYPFGKKYKLTRRRTAILLASLSVSVLLGLFLGYGIKQIEMPKYSVFTVGMLYVIPSELSSKIVWCMLGVIVGNYKTKNDKTI